MPEEPDGVEEVMESGLRVAVTAGAQGVEHVARVRAATARDARRDSEQRTRHDAARFDAERALARSQLESVAHASWWEHASPRDIAAAWDTATAWQDRDADAQRAVAVIAEQLRDRYDLQDIPADPRVLRDQIAERRVEQDARAAAAHATSPGEAAQAAALLSGPVDAAEPDGDRDEPDPVPDSELAPYDSRERRAMLAASLEGHAEPEAVAARVLADVSQALPAVEAVAHGPRPAPAARRSRAGTGRQLGSPRRSERAR